MDRCLSMCCYIMPIDHKENEEEKKAKEKHKKETKKKLVTILCRQWIIRIERFFVSKKKIYFNFLSRLIIRIDERLIGKKREKKRNINA